LLEVSTGALTKLWVFVPVENLDLSILFSSSILLLFGKWKILPTSVPLFTLLHSFNDIADESGKQEIQKLCMIEFIINFSSMGSEQLQRSSISLNGIPGK
jgi:hypothetical protein